MNFQDLLSRIRQLDTPVAPATPVAEKAVDECGNMPNPSPMMGKPDTPPPSLSINMNAQGMDDIADIMKLIAKVNPDMEKPMSPPMPGMGIDPISVTAIKPLAPEIPPLKMLPDLDSEPHAEPDADNMGGPSDMDADNMPDGMDGVSKAQGDQDNDGDHDMDDHDMEPKDDKGDDKDDEKKEWANDPDPELKDTDYMVNKLAGGLNKPKQMTPHGYRNGDNPLAMEGADLRAYIKTELAKKLQEAKLRNK